MSKAAMHPYVHNLASHYGHHGVNANAVALGTVGPTGPWLEALRSDPAILEKIGSRNPRGKVGSAGEAADVMLYLVRLHRLPPTVVFQGAGATTLHALCHSGSGFRVCLQASAESSLINGQVLVADGGWTLVAGTLDTANPDKIWYE